MKKESLQTIDEAKLLKKQDKGSDLNKKALPLGGNGIKFREEGKRRFESNIW
jgi:hypothetical protein